MWEGRAGTRDDRETATGVFTICTFNKRQKDFSGTGRYLGRQRNRNTGVFTISTCNKDYHLVFHAFELWIKPRRFILLFYIIFFCFCCVLFLVEDHTLPRIGPCLPHDECYDEAPLVGSIHHRRAGSTSIEGICGRLGAADPFIST